MERVQGTEEAPEGMEPWYHSWKVVDAVSGFWPEKNTREVVSGTGLKTAMCRVNRGPPLAAGSTVFPPDYITCRMEVWFHGRALD